MASFPEPAISIAPTSYSFEACLSLKEAGNVKYKESDYGGALAAWNEALTVILPRLDDTPSLLEKQLIETLHSNAAAVHISTKSWEDAVRSASASLAINAHNSVTKLKAQRRKAQALMELGLLCDCEDVIRIAYKTVVSEYGDDPRPATQKTVREFETWTEDFGRLTDPATCFLALKEVPPNILESIHVSDMSILFLGARESEEEMMDFSYLYRRMKVLFPSLNRLSIGLIGKEVTTQAEHIIEDTSSPTSSSKISLYTCEGFYHDVYPELAAKYQTPQLAVLLNPGISANYGWNWNKTMDLLLDNRVLTIASGYSSSSRWTYDGAVDDFLYEARYGVSFVVEKTRCRAMRLHQRQGFRNAFYLVFRGRSEVDSLLDETEVIRGHRVRFLEWLGEVSIEDEGRPQFGRACQALAKELQDGSKVIPDNVTLQQIEQSISREHC